MCSLNYHGGLTLSEFKTVTTTTKENRNYVLLKTMNIHNRHKSAGQHAVLLYITLPWPKCLKEKSGEESKGKTWARQTAERGQKGADRVRGNSSEAQYHQYQVNKTKYDTGACGIIYVLWFVISELFSSLKAPLPTVKPIAQGHSESCKGNTT